MNLKNLTSLEKALAAAGLVIEHIVFDRLTKCPTTEDKGSKKSGWYRVFDGERPICIYGDFRGIERGIWVADADKEASPDDRERARRLAEQAKQERQEQMAKEWRDNATRITNLQKECKSVVEGDAVATYLRNRGIPCPQTPALLRHDHLRYFEDGSHKASYPAMIGLVTALDGKLINIHRTYLSNDGTKAPVDIPRKLMASSGLMMGASIKMGAPVPHKDGGLMIGIAEGIETALAASLLGGLPVWSCISAHGLRSFVPPEEVKHVYIFGDHDKSGVGQEAANECGQRLARLGLSARILIPETEGDWNDELIALGATV